MKAAENAVILWQGWLDLNQRMRESKSLALPLGYTPIRERKGIGTLFPIPLFLGWVKGLEPSTPGTTIRCSNQLSYTHHISGITKGSPRRRPLWGNGTPEGIRTPGLLLRRQLLYPAELLAQMDGAGDGESNPHPQLGRLVPWPLCYTCKSPPQPVSFCMIARKRRNVKMEFYTCIAKYTFFRHSR